MPDRLRPLWDFDDLDASEVSFREQLERETTDEGRAEVLTQLARVEGLRGRFEEGEKLIREAEALAGSHARIDLERGRLKRSSGDETSAFSLFVRAFESSDGFIAADAAHMVALVDPAGPEEWTRRGLELAQEDPDAAYWAGPLLNNLGWHYYDTRDFKRALDAFERALEARERDPANAKAIKLARDDVEQARCALER